MPPACLQRSAGPILLLLAVTIPARSQERVRMGGLAYIDYSYVLDDAAGREGDNGFGYRRVYLTGDYALSPRLSVRARLEATDGGLNSAGRPSPFVKDLYVKWSDAVAPGHALWLGVSAPPGWEVSEGFLGYRSLEATVMDRQGIASSRDFGIRATGPLSAGGRLRYNVMFANNNSVNRESDRFKILYAQIEARPSDRLTVTAGGDYAALDAGSSYTANAFIGVRLRSARIGVEGYFSPVRAVVDIDRTGVSLFGAFSLDSDLEAVLRYDAHAVETGARATGWYGLAGLAWSPEPGLRIIPNLVLDRSPGAARPTVTGRATVHVDF